MKNIVRVIWDFNGTLIDDVQTGIDAVNVLLSRRGLPVIDSIEKYHAIFGFPIRDYYTRAGFDFSHESFEVIAPEWVAEYLMRESKAPLCPGVVEALKILREAGVEQYLISATEQSMLNSQVERHGLKSYFSGIYGLDNIHANSKSALVCNFLAGKDGRTVMLGDTEHDAYCAKNAGAEAILIAKGHQSFETLAATGCIVADTALCAARIILGEL